MEYQKIKNSLLNEVTRPSKFRAKNWVDMTWFNLVGII